MDARLETVVVGSMLGLAVLVWLGGAYGARLAGITAARALSGWGVFFGIWVLLAIVLGARGVFQTQPDARFPVVLLAIVLPIVVGVVLARAWPLLRQSVAALPQHWLIGLQLYRCFGAIFLVLHARGNMPGAFALPAGYGDVLVGITAPLVAWLYFRSRAGSRTLALLWNVVGIADLLMAVTLGFLTSPGQWQQLALSSPNELITAFPLALIPTFAVPLSILLHIASLWHLGRASSTPPWRSSMQVRE